MSDIGAVTYKGGHAVTPSDTTADTNGPFDALLATTAAGTAKVTSVDGSVLTVYLALGIPMEIACTRVWSTGTAATGITGLKAAHGSVTGIHA